LPGPTEPATTVWKIVLGFDYENPPDVKGGKRTLPWPSLAPILFVGIRRKLE
jgi:hypothetical protein